MKASELRIGNYINSLGQQFNDENQFKGWNNYVVKVDIDVLKNIFIENKDFKYSPVPLNEEYLLKFGFEKYLSGFKLAKSIPYTEIKITKKGFYTDTELYNYELSYNQSNRSILYISIFYIHQLQNLYFALTGEELEIK